MEHLKLFCASTFSSGYDSYSVYIVAVREFNEIEPLLKEAKVWWDMITNLKEIGLADESVKEPSIIHTIN